MSSDDLLSHLSPHLFWDVELNKLDPNAGSTFIIKKVLEYGLWEDWLLIKHFYGLETITAVVKNLRELDSKALSFIASISQTPREEFRCYTTRQLTPLHWNF
jgi:hypothetical protein